MSTLTIDLPEDAQAQVEARVSVGAYDTANAYIVELIRRDRESDSRLKQLLTEGIKGPFERVTDEWWASLDAEVDGQCSGNNINEPAR